MNLKDVIEMAITAVGIYYNYNPLLKETIIANLRNLIERDETIKTNLFDTVETFNDCTVEVLRNTITGDISVGWYRNDSPPIGL